MASKAIKREMIQPHEDDTRYARRDAEGQFTEKQADRGRSLSADNNQSAKANVPKGHGDRGDHRKK